MAKAHSKLTVLALRAAKRPGLYHDGGGLYLQVTARKDGGVNRSWLLRFRVKGQKRTREMGIGPLQTIDLVAARAEALKAQKLAQSGIDPIEQRKEDIRRAAREATKAVTFKEVAERYIRELEPTWKNEKHRQQWPNTMRDYVYPVVGNLSVQAIATDDILKILRPIWTEKRETATRVRARIERVIDYAMVTYDWTGANPARLKGHLENALPRTKAKVRHHAAMPYSQLPALMVALQKRETISARALAITILCATRTSETIKAPWSEIDLEQTLWVLPDERMKTDKAHRIPLVTHAVRTFEKIRKTSPHKKFVFVARDDGNPLCVTAMSNMLDRVLDELRFPHYSVHGFRSSFRDWAAETTTYPREVVEVALSHANPNKVEAAYRRTDYFDVRKKLMSDWAAFCLGEPKARKPRKRA